MSCGVGHRSGSDLALLWLWLWHRLAAVALIGPLAWEPPYASRAALKSKKKKKQTKKPTLNLKCTTEVPTVVKWNQQCLRSSRDVSSNPSSASDKNPALPQAAA